LNSGGEKKKRGFWFQRKEDSSGVLTRAIKGERNTLLYDGRIVCGLRREGTNCVVFECLLGGGERGVGKKDTGKEEEKVIQTRKQKTWLLVKNRAQE